MQDLFLPDNPQFEMEKDAEAFSFYLSEDTTQ